MRRRELLFGMAALSAACGPRRLPPPPPAPRVVAAAELIPPDLDVIARLDMAKMKAALGGLTPQLLSREVLARGNADGEEPEELVVESLLEADVVYLGYRPSSLFLPLDRVLALQGRFSPITKTPPGFLGGIDLGADVRYWDRQRTKPLARSASARLYAAGDRVRAFVSEAELDAVERALDRLGEPRSLSAPEEGALSLAARPRLLGKLVSGTLRELLEDSRSLELVIDLESDMASLRASLQTSSPEHAERLASAGRAVVQAALGERAKRAEMRAVESRVSFTLRLPREELAALLPRGTVPPP
ncbi:MAG: hypothetical protein K0R38_2517 [Polyangiaceae bacterium]|jgi:hypothetical protein|nr:hypothetical protein [Polyangiaceae bacterium]